MDPFYGRTMWGVFTKMTSWVGADDKDNDPTVVTEADVTLVTHTGEVTGCFPAAEFCGVPAADMIGSDCPAVAFSNPAISWDPDGMRL